MTPASGSASAPLGAAGARPLQAIVIATSSGAPMHSARPKPLHVLCGRPMLRYVLDALSDAGAADISVVTGSAGERISKRIMEDPPSARVTWVEQRAGKGSADAAQLALTEFDDLDDDGGDVVVMPADLPLVRAESLAALVAAHRSSGAACTVLTAPATGPDDRRARVQRDRHDRVRGLVRHVELIGDEGESDEVSLGVYCVRRSLLAPATRRVLPDLVDGRQRMVDVPGVLAESGHPVETASVVAEPGDVQAIDDRVLLADAEAELRRRINRRWLEHGVTMVDPAHTYIDSTVVLGTDVTLFPGTILQGRTVIADGCEIGPDTRLDRCSVGANSVVEKTMARLATIGDDCRVGPFAAVEPGAEVGDGTITGPFYAAGAGA